MVKDHVTITELVAIDTDGDGVPILHASPTTQMNGMIVMVIGVGIIQMPSLTMPQKLKIPTVME